MNAIQLLKNEHETAKRTLGQILAASADQRAELWAKLEPQLKVHEQIEEAALYGPVAQEVGSRDQSLKEWQEHHLEEVTELEALIQEIGGLDPTDDQWTSKIEKLREMLEDHVQEEEGDIWPRIQQAWDQSKLEHAGEQMETLKRQKMPRAARASGCDVPAGSQRQRGERPATTRHPRHRRACEIARGLR